MTGKVLVTGSTGLIGTALMEHLEQGGARVHELSRRKTDKDTMFHWDIDQRILDLKAIEGVNTIVHLSGASIADGRWSKKRKQEMLDSRINSTRLLLDTLKNSDHQVRTLVCASAIGYYGFDRGKDQVDEKSAPGDDFLAGITIEWEKEAAKFKEIGIRVVSLRIGMVLSTKGGALPEIMKPVKWMAGAPLGRGDQYMSWIHIDDMVRIISRTIDDQSMEGAYNAVAPQPETNRIFTRILAKVMKKPFFLPPVPGFVLRMIVGEMAVLVLGGLNVSCTKLSEAGFSFNYPGLQSALENLITEK